MACTEPLLELEDQSYALQLQLEEIEALREGLSGKWNENSPPDFALASDQFGVEVEKAISLLEDLKLAHSIAKAVDTDHMAIDEIRVEEIQSGQDRAMALSLREDEEAPVQRVVGLPDMSHLGSVPVDMDYVQRAAKASTRRGNASRFGNAIAGPSVPYAERQRAVFEQLPQLKVDCSVCGDSCHPHAIITLPCHHAYCKPCLKSFFVHIAKDENLFPPRCCRIPIDISTIAACLSPQEMTTYRKAELEFTSTDRVYCADPECATFIPLSRRTRRSASCEACKARTCVSCKKLAHDGYCIPDEATRSLITLVNERGYQPCYRCSEMISRDVGCDHMTCRCGAEFCYRCGVKWKQCHCGDYDLADAPRPRVLPPGRGHNQTSRSRRVETSSSEDSDDSD